MSSPVETEPRRPTLIEVMGHPDPEGEHRPGCVARQRERFAGSERISDAELGSAD